MASVAPAPVAVAEVKALLRIATSDEDALIAGFVRSAAASCEAFIGRALIVREVTETIAANGVWTRVAAAPVRSIDAVAALAADGGTLPLDVQDYAIDVDAAGEGWVRVPWRGTSGRAAVTFSAGLAEDWNNVPEPLRQGIVRLAAHLYSVRGESEAPPPASVAALWRPWRRLRLG